MSKTLTLSRKAIYDLIIEREVSSREYYNAKLKSPVWPGKASGVTIGLGYDVGYTTQMQLQEDWSGILQPSEIMRLARYCGKSGSICQTFLPIPIRISWEDALKVFYNTSLTHHTSIAAGVYGGLEKLHPYEQTAIVGLVFNRGGSLIGERRLEMAQLVDAIKSDNDKMMASLIRHMERLWPDSKGLRYRRELEAKYIEMPDDPIPDEDKLVIIVKKLS